MLKFELEGPPSGMVAMNVQESMDTQETIHTTIKTELNAFMDKLKDPQLKQQALVHYLVFTRTGDYF